MLETLSIERQLVGANAIGVWGRLSVVSTVGQVDGSGFFIVHVLCPTCRKHLYSNEEKDEFTLSRPHTKW